MSIKIQQTIREVIEIESKSLSQLSRVVDVSYEDAIKVLLACKGKVVITGVGKSGHIGKKIAASFASTGTPAFFMHSTEGIHGDLGMVTSDDVVILISNSGETAELLNLLPTLRIIKAKTIAISKDNNSTLAKSVDVALAYQYTEEADHMKLAPTTSATMTLVIGDALAVTLSKAKEFNSDDFHLFHPGGSLGNQLQSKKS